MYSVLVFGEVLFDHFPDSRVLGGAPFNVAWHLQGFGDDPLFISRVGNDDRGREVRERMADWGMDLNGLQLDTEHPTGVVEVNLAQGQPSYKINTDQAYDFTDFAEAMVHVEDSDPAALFYHGSLALRQGPNRKTWQGLRQKLPDNVFVDLNLRKPWWSKELWPQILQDCRYLKLNDQELSALAGRELPEWDDLAGAAMHLIEQHHIEQVWVTRGSEGALVQQKGAEYVWSAAQPVPEMQDAVGAGDAFSAVLLHGLRQGWQTENLLRRALTFAAELCRHRGALLYDKAVYQEFLRRWGENDAVGD